MFLAPPTETQHNTPTICFFFFICIFCMTKHFADRENKSSDRENKSSILKKDDLKMRVLSSEPAFMHDIFFSCLFAAVKSL